MSLPASNQVLRYGDLTARGSAGGRAGVNEFTDAAKAATIEDAIIFAAMSCSHPQMKVVVAAVKRKERVLRRLGLRKMRRRKESTCAKEYERNEWSRILPCSPSADDLSTSIWM